jgi:glycosyltransferase involved in cell wall biosynthesis
MAGGPDQMEVVSLDAPDNQWGAQWPIPVHCLGPGRTFFRYVGGLTDWLCAQKSNFDAVVVNGLWRYPSTSVWSAHRRCDLPYFVIPHGMLSPWFRESDPAKHLRKRVFWEIVEKRVLSDAAAVMFTCEEERKAAFKDFPIRSCREATNHLGIAPPGSPSKESTKKLLEAFPKLNSDQLLVFIGRLVPQKACDILLRALAQIAKQFPRAHLAMVGPDFIGWRPVLEALANKLGLRERVTWVGPLYGQDKAAVLSLARLFVSPSRFDAFPIAVLEALSAGVPVVITRQVNIHQEIADGGAGWVADCDVAAVAKSLCAAITACEKDPKSYQQSALMLFQRSFSIEQSASGHIKTIARFL